MAERVPERLDLLVVMSDQHSPHVLGCAGDPVVRTPHLDGLAARGVRFSATYCQAPLCVPSRMSCLTGQQPSALRVWTNSCVLGSDVPAFAHALGAAGYDTALCGRMHFMGPDQRHGFHRRMVGDVTSSYFGGPGPNFGHVPLSTAQQGRGSVEISGPGRTSYQAYDAEVTQAALHYLHARAQPAERQPFCLVVGYVLPHCPYICPKPLFDEYYDRVDVPRLPAAYLERLHPAMRLWRERRGVDERTDEEVRRARAAYYGLVTLLDHNVGRLLAALEDTGLAQRTAVVYTSDHGEMAGEHRMWWKSSLYEGSVGVPMIWSWPGRFAPARTVSAVASLVDVAPTLLALGGAPALPNATGHNLLPWLSNRSGGDVPDGPQEAYAEVVPGLGLPPARLVRRGPWKLTVHHGHATPQLFNLEDDPHELDDRGADPGHADVREALLAAALDGWSGAAIEETLRRRAADRQLLAGWYRAHTPPDPDYWSIAPEYNVFPEE
ncbi:MAG: sulfatase-like hydrolase/transferase [Chloroflexi bacterium]|nr:sulfatase-like hydrolase/transferase [Chloroflexota bacterium]